MSLWTLFRSTTKMAAMVNGIAGGLLAFLFFSKQFLQYFTVIYFLILVLNIISAAVVVIVEPYKEEYSTFNFLFADFFLWCGLFLETIANDNLYIILQVVLSDHYICSVILALIPLVYIIGVAVYHCIRRF